jgi:hypothetical protein
MTNSPSLDQLKQAIALKEQIAALETQLADILGGTAETPTITTQLPPRRGRAPGSKMSAEARARIAAAQKARWAKYRESKGTASKSTPPKKGGMSREERGRVAAKARWAKFRAEKGEAAPAKVGMRAVSGKKHYVFTDEHRARLAAAQKLRFAKFRGRG